MMKSFLFVCGLMLGFVVLFLSVNDYVISE